jgi:proteasome assembly chaperone (PAC2) family protein
MGIEHLKIFEEYDLKDAQLVIGFSGWMDGGDVSTGAVEYLNNKLDAVRVAEIDPNPFYIYSFPGSMEVAALFRPYVRIENGLITQIDEPKGVFYASPAADLVLFEGKEPNLRWHDFAECIFGVAERFRVSRMYFIGSVAGLAPHTRDPRVFTSVSDSALLPALKRHGVTPSNYEGPGSFITFLTTLAAERGIPLVTLVAETQAYIQGKNIKCLEAVVRRLVAVANLPIDVSDLAAAGREFEQRLNAVVRERPDLEEMIRKMEENYDQQLHESTDEELKAWLERQGIRLE